MKLDRAQKIVESMAKEERNFAYGEWDRAEAICTVLVEIQMELRRRLESVAIAPTTDAEQKPNK